MIWKYRQFRGFCVSCGRNDWIDATDNFGNPYKGCRWCRIVGSDALEALRAAKDK